MATVGILKSQGATAGASLAWGSPKVAGVTEVRSCHVGFLGRASISHGVVRLREGNRVGSPLMGHSRRVPPVKRILKPVAAETGATNGGDPASSGESTANQTKAKVERKGSEVRSRITKFFERKSGYSWVLGPAAVTALIVIPSVTLNLAKMFENNFLAGLVSTFALDILFVLSVDLFLVLAEKFGHHRQVDGGSPPWIGPWEYTGYPMGYPKLLNVVSYASVGVGILAMLLSVFTGKLPAALATFGPYLGLIFTQVVYERLVGSDRLPVFPLVPIVYTVYRFKQLYRGLALLPSITNGSPLLTTCIHMSSVLWTLYLGMYLTQLPWLYSTWNSNRAT